MYCNEGYTFPSNKICISENGLALCELCLLEIVFTYDFNQIQFSGFMGLPATQPEFNANI